MSPLQLYTLPALAEAVGIGYGSLRAWTRAGYLQPYTMVGNRPYYTMDEFEVAAKRALEESKANARKSAAPAETTLEQDAKTYDAIVKKHSISQGLQRPGRIRERITSTRKRGAL